MSKIERLTPEEQAELEKGTVAVKPESEVAAEDPAIIEVGPQDTGEDLDDWASAALPHDLKIPMGRTVVIMRFRAEWTDTVHKGDRTCVLWNLSVGDGKLANLRGADNGFNTMIERAKQMVRAVDGNVVVWDRACPGNIKTWWEEIGEKCRNLIVAHYTKSHSLSMPEKLDFFAHCVVARTNLPIG
jgi:hypothetical protein